MEKIPKREKSIHEKKLSRCFCYWLSEKKIRKKKLWMDFCEFNEVNLVEILMLHFEIIYKEFKS